MVRWRRALVLLAGGLLLAACSNHSGLRRLHPSDGAASDAFTPTAIAAAASSSASSSASASHTARPSHPPTPTPAASSTSAAGGASHGVERHRPSSSSARHRPPSSAASSSRPPARAAVSVSPARGLHDGQAVTVSGTHLSAGERVDVRECRADLSSCAGFSGTPVTVAGGGSFRSSFTVSRSVWLTDCGRSGCAIRVQRANGSVLLAPISFG